jgi:hypothetical protein
MTEVCVPNIGPREHARRLRIGVAMFIVAIVMGVLLMTTGASRVWRATVFLPLLIGAFGVLQVRAHTCVALAARGLRNMDAGDEPIADAAELRAVKAQARRVNIQAMALAATLTAVFVALP